MASTPRLNLYLAGGGSTGAYTPDETADIDSINQNFVAIDTYIALAPFTSTTRPSSPFDGQMIQETDTKDIYFWNGSLGQWRQVFPHVGTAAPANPQDGFVWIDTT